MDSLSGSKSINISVLGGKTLTQSVPLELTKGFVYTIKVTKVTCTNTNLIVQEPQISSTEDQVLINFLIVNNLPLFQSGTLSFNYSATIVLNSYYTSLQYQYYVSNYKINDTSYKEKEKLANICPLYECCSNNVKILDKSYYKQSSLDVVSLYGTPYYANDTTTCDPWNGLVELPSYSTNSCYQFPNYSKYFYFIEPGTKPYFGVQPELEIISNYGTLTNVGTYGDDAISIDADYIAEGPLATSTASVTTIQIQYKTDDAGEEYLSLTKGLSESRYYASSFLDRSLPKRMILALQGAGGGGSVYQNISMYHFAPGSSGCFSICVVDLEKLKTLKTQQGWTSCYLKITLGKAGQGTKVENWSALDAHIKEDATDGGSALLKLIATKWDDKILIPIEETIITCGGGYCKSNYKKYGQGKLNDNYQLIKFLPCSLDSSSITNKMFVEGKGSIVSVEYPTLWCRSQEVWVDYSVGIQPAQFSSGTYKWYATNKTEDYFDKNVLSIQHNNYITENYTIQPGGDKFQIPGSSSFLGLGGGNRGTTTVASNCNGINGSGGGMTWVSGVVPPPQPFGDGGQSVCMIWF